jgi:hypothetical protein
MISVMHTLFNYYKNTLLAICYISLLTGCGNPWIATEKPFNDPLVTITPGQTTRENVHGLLGKPLCCTKFLSPSRDKGNVEVFLAKGDALGWAGFIPFPSTDRILHYAMIAYDLSGLVNEIDSGHVATNAMYPGHDVKQITSGRVAYSDSVDRIFLYAGEYGYYNRSNTFFPSKDGGGKSDSAWEDYIKYMVDDIKYHKHNLKLLCRAVEQGHPAAFSELGNLFRENGKAFGYPSLQPVFQKDNVMACFWFSMANDGPQTEYCLKLLTKDEKIKVEYLMYNWQLDQCELGINDAGSGD